MTPRVRVVVTFTVSGLGLGALEVLLARTALAQWRLLRSPGPASLDEALTFLAAVVAVALGAWLALTTTAAVAAHAPGRVGAAADRWAQAWSPQVSRRVAGMLVGATLGGALAPGTALGDGAVGDTADRAARRGAPRDVTIGKRAPIGAQVQTSGTGRPLYSRIAAPTPSATMASASWRGHW